MAAQGVAGDAVSHMFGIEAAMEAWHRAGQPDHLLTQADVIWRQSPVAELKPILKSRDNRLVIAALHVHGLLKVLVRVLKGLSNKASLLHGHRRTCAKCLLRSNAATQSSGCTHKQGPSVHEWQLYTCFSLQEAFWQQLG